LNFLGDCDRHQLNDLDAALAALSVERFELSVAGTGAFGGGTPHLLYAGLEENTPLRRLQTKTHVNSCRMSHWRAVAAE